MGRELCVATDKKYIFLARQAVNIAVNKIDI